MPRSAIALIVLAADRALLRVNGSWDLLCWPDPSEICDMAQIRAQRAHPITE